MGVRDPDKRDNTHVRGRGAVAIVACAAAAGMMSLVCSFFDVGAMEMLMLQLVLLNLVVKLSQTGANWRR
jgi:hypothetical protein